MATPTEIWTHKHPSRQSTDMRGYQVSTYEEVAALRQEVAAIKSETNKIYALVQQINRVIVLGGGATVASPTGLDSPEL